MKLAPYPRYKPSGVEWLGNVPEHWDTKPLGRLVRFFGGATPDKSKSEYWEGEIPWVSPKDMKRQRIKDAPDHVSMDALRNYPLRLLPVRSVLVVVRGMILAHSFPVALTDAPVTINQDMKALKCGNQLAPSFLIWSLTGLAPALVSLADESAHGTRKIETEVLSRFPLPTPSLQEQSSIADFLDRETTKIDTLVARKRTLIERLKEKRTALISRTVTRGLFPDVAAQAGLAPQPNLKPSGIDWLGDVPEHWATWKVTHGFRKIGSGTTPKSDAGEYYDGDILWVTTAELRESVILDTRTKVTAAALRDYPTLRLYSPGTLLVAMYGATIGRLGVLGIAATANQACAAFSEPQHLHTRFVYYWLQMRRPVLISLSAGGGQSNLGQDDLRQLRIPAPPLTEQAEIAAFLDRETAKCDAMGAKIEAAIERLQEYRTALITAAVTGKIDVQGTAA